MWGEAKYSFFAMFLLCLGLIHAQTFSNEAVSRGIDFTSGTLDTWGSGVSFFDFNQDGWDDLSFARENQAPIFYQNNQGNFQEVSMGVFPQGKAKAILWADYDNDYDLDLFLTALDGKIQLYQNQGNFSFLEVSAAAGLYTGAARNYGAAFADYDRDGFLDLYVCRYDINGDSSNLSFLNNLYHNNGDGTFTDVSIFAGVDDGLAQSFQPVWFDFNHDFWPDLYVVNDKQEPGRLYVNNQDGTFTDLTLSANLADGSSDLMTGTVGDFNNDNRLDLFVSNIGGSSSFSPRLYENRGDSTFINVYNSLISTMDATTWGGLWFDADNDGWQDLYVATDFLSPLNQAVPSYFYRNTISAGFTQDSVSFLANPSAQSHAVARGDVNQDGFYDLVVYNEEPDTSFLWLNNGTSNNYVKITLEGTVSNSFAIGSFIQVFAGGQQYTQYTMCGENYIGQNSQHHIFGLAQLTMIDSVWVEFPSGIINKYYNLPVNQSYHFIEGETVNDFFINVVGNMPFCAGDSIQLWAPEALSYVWSTGDLTQAITVYEEGSYQVEIIDSLGLTRQSVILFVEKIEAPQISITTQNAQCNNSADGSITLMVANQGQSYSINWGDTILGELRQNLSAGDYQYTYVDAFGCLLSDTISILEPFPINGQYDISPASESQLGSLSIVINGGTSPYLSLLSGDTIDGQAFDLSPGMYALIITDNNDCLYEDSIVIPLENDTVINSSVTRSNLPFEIFNDVNQSQIVIHWPMKVKGALEIELFSVLGKQLSSYNVDLAGISNLRLDYPNNIRDGWYILQLRFKNNTLRNPMLIRSQR